MKLHLPKGLVAALAAVYAVTATVGTGMLTIGGLAALSTSSVAYANTDYYNGPDSVGHSGSQVYYLINSKDVSEYTLDTTATNSFWIVGDDSTGTVRDLAGINAKAGASMNIGWSGWHATWGLSVVVDTITIGDGTEAASLNVDPGSSGAVINAHIKNVSGVLSGVTNSGTLTLGGDGTIKISGSVTNSGTLNFTGAIQFDVSNPNAYTLANHFYDGIDDGEDGICRETATYALIINNTGATFDGVSNITCSNGAAVSTEENGNVILTIADTEDRYVIRSGTEKNSAELSALGAKLVTVAAGNTINCDSADIGLDRISGEGNVIVSADMSLTDSKVSLATGQLTVTNGATLTVGSSDSQVNSLTSFAGVVLDNGTISYNNRHDTLNNVTVGEGKTGTIHSQDMGASGNTLTLAGTTAVNGTLKINNSWNAQFEIAELSGSGVLTLGDGSAWEAATYSVNLGTFAGTINVNDEKSTVTLNGAINSGTTITNTQGTVKYMGSSVTDATLDGVVLGGSQRVTVSGTVNIKDMTSCDLTNSTYGYAFVGSGTLNFSGVSDLTHNSAGDATTHSKIGLGAGSVVNVKEGASLTVGGLINSSSNPSSNGSVNVEQNAVLVLSDSGTHNYIVGITNNGTMTTNGEVTVSNVVNDGTMTTNGAVTAEGVVNNGNMIIKNRVSFGSLSGDGRLTLEENGLAVFDAQNYAEVSHAITLKNGASLAVRDNQQEVYNYTTFSNLKLEGNATLITGQNNAWGSGIIVNGLDTTGISGGTTLTLKDEHAASNYASVVSLSKDIEGSLNGTLAIDQHNNGSGRKFVVIVDNESLLENAVVNMDVKSSDGYAALAIGSAMEGGADTVKIKGLTSENSRTDVISYNGDAYTATTEHTEGQLVSAGGHTLEITGNGDYSFAGTLGSDLNISMTGTGSQTVKNIGANGKVNVSQGTLIVDGDSTADIGSITVSGGALNIKGNLSTSEAVTVSGGTLAVTSEGNLTMVSAYIKGTADLANGSVVNGDLTIANGGKLQLGGASESGDNVATINGTVTFDEGSVLSLTTKLDATGATEGSTYVLAQASSFVGVENLNLTMEDIFAGGTLGKGLTFTLEALDQPALATFALSRDATPSAMQQLVLNITAQAEPIAPDNLVATGVNTSYADDVLTIGINSDLTGVSGDLTVAVDYPTWDAIKAAMGDSFSDDALVTVSLMGTDGVTLNLADYDGVVSFNGYTGTDEKGQYVVGNIPEPATATLSLLALAALAARRRRKG